jgi:plastocyanin
MRRAIAVLSIRMAGTRVAALPPAAPADVTITGFAFGPAKLSGQSGKPVTWLNQDDSPHMIVVPSAKLATGMLAKGQSGALTFGTPGTYDYICGLHPAMKGSVEIK